MPVYEKENYRSPAPVRTFVGPNNLSAIDMSNKYRRMIDLEGSLKPMVQSREGAMQFFEPEPSNKKSVTRNLIQFSERKKDRLKYADPMDHAFNYETKFTDRPRFA